MPATSPLPRVSVALCSYNGERHLREQLDSILAQRGVEVDVVALDDGSSDGTVALLEEYAARDPRIVVQRNAHNLGHLRSFEKCMALCRADYIAPSDQDDIWHPDKLRMLLDAIGDADMAYCDSEYVDEDGNSLGYGISDELKMIRGKQPLRFVFGNSVSGHALLVRRSLLPVAMPFPDGLYHDWWLAMCAAGRNGLVYVDRALVSFRRHASATTTIGKKRENKKKLRRSWHLTHAAREESRRRKRLLFAPWLNRKWVEERLFLAERYASLPLRDSGIAGSLHRALRLGIDERDYAPLRDVLWQLRAMAPASPWAWCTWWNVHKFFRRTVRRIERSRDEPPPQTPLFHAN